MDLLRWWRFLQAVEVSWNRATRREARDFSCWIQLTVKQRRRSTRSSSTGWANGVAGPPNPITGKPALGDGMRRRPWRIRRRCCGVSTTSTERLAPGRS
ncbi:hypothetical protein AB0M12_12285 [Nocardia vinacea]|uniref:hypothetical protein n=1 Tax=Nocardia vinacea TaxID=96468 RepID=UPI003429B380